MQDTQKFKLYNTPHSDAKSHWDFEKMNIIFNVLRQIQSKKNLSYTKRPIIFPNDKRLNQLAVLDT